MAAYGVVSQPYGVDDSSLVSLVMELHFDDADPFSLDRQFAPYDIGLILGTVKTVTCAPIKWCQ